MQSQDKDIAMTRVWRAFRRFLRVAGVRVLLVAGFAAAAHLFDWIWLRELTVSGLMQMSALIGLGMHRIAFDTITVAGIAAQVVVACTMIDAFCGAVPLLWRTNISWPRNLLRLSGVFAGVFVLNVVRLELGFVALSRGVPWWLAHECVAGVTYFCLYAFIMHERAWEGGVRELRVAGCEPLGWDNESVALR